MRNVLWLLPVLWIHVLFAGDSPPAVNEVLHKIIETAKQNEKKVEAYGFYLDNHQKKLTESGAIKEEEEKTFRITWIENKPYLELLKVNGKEPEPKERKKEQERREKFMKSLKEKPKGDGEDFSWDDLSEKFDFSPGLRSDSASHVLSFRPKKQKQKERTRTEKLINRLSGTIWADSEYNLLRIEASLLEPVRFGLGLLAKIQDLHINYEQQRINDIWFPSTLLIRGQAQIALFKNERREITTKYYEYYVRPAETQAGSK